MLTFDPSAPAQARENSAQLEALQTKVTAGEAEKQTLSAKLAESQDAVSQLKQLVENHVASEREKNKRVRGAATAGLDGATSCR